MKEGGEEEGRGKGERRRGKEKGKGRTYRKYQIRGDKTNQEGKRPQEGIKGETKTMRRKGKESAPSSS